MLLLSSFDICMNIFNPTRFNQINLCKNSSMVYSLQVDSGFFLDSDVKVISKSIRDRVALIKWRRQRIVSGSDEQTEKIVTKTETQNLLQAPSTGLPAGGPETEELQSEPITLVGRGPVSGTTATREDK